MEGYHCLLWCSLDITSPQPLIYALCTSYQLTFLLGWSSRKYALYGNHHIHTHSISCFFLTPLKIGPGKIKWCDNTDWHHFVSNVDASDNLILICFYLFQWNFVCFFRCDECDLFPIVGPRYKCQKCANYDMCENCFRIKKHRHNHVFTKIAEPGIVHVFSVIMMYMLIESYRNEHVIKSIFIDDIKVHVPKLHSLFRKASDVFTPIYFEL